MITYSANWMGPLTYRWYEENNIPYVWKTSSGRFSPIKEYKDYTENYSCGRIDIYGLDTEKYLEGKTEYRVGIMRTEDWHAFGNWLHGLSKHNLATSLATYNELICNFERVYGQSIRWMTNYENETQKEDIESGS